MDIYLAGGYTGNLAPIWQREAQQIGGGQNDEYLLGRGASREERQTLIRGGQKILESFYYCRDNDWIPRLLPFLGDFLLDSGAFTFMQGAAHVDWDAYVEEYAAWINKHKIEKFFELDIDSVVGLKEVERLRKKLEGLTNRQPIPVWHLSRGVDYFLNQMCGEYSYVALGGIVGAKKGGEQYKRYQNSFPWFIREAHKRGAKIHGLGFTSLEGLKKYHFDSVDSTAWLYGNRGGYLYLFDPKTGNMGKKNAPPGHRLKSSDAARWNFNEWIKFQRYAEKYL